MSGDGKDRTGPGDLGIDLSKGSDAAAFKWFVACQLFGARINQEIAARAYAELDDAGLTSPKSLAGADWQAVVDAVGRGGYRRYDESTARELVAMGQDLVGKYGGSMHHLRDAAADADDLQARLQEFKGIGPKSTEIFLREVGWT